MAKLNTTYLQTRINFMFLILAVALEGAMAIYWMTVLEPQVMEKVRITANRMAQSQAHFLVDALTSGKGDVHDAQVIKAIDRMLILKDPETGDLFTKGVEVEVNCNMVRACEGELSLNRGDSSCDECFVTEITLYSENAEEPLGIARLHNSNDFFLHFRRGVKSMFFAGAGVGLVLLLLTWFFLNGMIVKIKKAEKELEEKEAQLIHSGRLVAMGEMATGIAHEINQPLSIIRVAADGLNAYFKRKDPGTMEEEATESIIGQIDRASAIINNMRSFVRAGSDPPESADLAEPVKAAISFFKEQFRIHGIALNVSLSDNLPEVRTDPQKFEQIVVNLLSNARYAVDKKDEISGKEYQKRVAVRLGYDEGGDTVVFEIEDNGIGMTPEVLDRCMEPFYTTKDVGEGTGIGLSIVNGFVREFKMTIEPESVCGEGSIFRIRIRNKQQ